MTNIVGFTGTRNGMTIEQRHAFAALIVELGTTSFHHGDCVGADAEAHDLVREHIPSATITVHPGPDGTGFRAYKKADASVGAKPFLDRNKCIVDSTSALIAAVNSPTEKLRSGTWSTVRYAAKKGRKVYVIFPDGSVTQYAKKVN